MGGVGGRSKACDNCRRRRIKCDEQRPKCLRCQKAKLECGGYPGMTFIQFDGRQRHKILPEPYSRAISLAKSRQSPPFIGGKYILTQTHIPLNLDGIFVAFAHSRLLRGWDVANLVLPAHVDRDMAESSFLAFSTTYFGIERQEKSIICQGLQRYGTVLEMVNKALEDPSRCTSFDLLESVTILLLFEFIISDRENGWLSHCIGLQNLFSFRRPESFAKVPDLLVFENSRISIIISSLILRQPSIFCSPEWKTIPWTCHPERKTLLQYLIDIFADCPALFVTKLRIMSQQTWVVSNQEAELTNLLDQVDHLLDQLGRWKMQWNVKNTQCCHEILPSYSIPETSGPQYEGDIKWPAWTTIWEYKSQYHADSIALYDGITILLLILAQTILNESEMLSVLTNYHLFDFRERLYMASLNICRSAEYHLHSMKEGAGNFQFLWSLRMAYEATKFSHPSISIWIHNILQKIQDGTSSRWAMAKYVLEIGMTPLTKSP